MKNLIGKKFGRLKVIAMTNNRSHESVVWKCQCKCGAEILVTTRNLQSGHTKSCGCLWLEAKAKNGRKHGHNSKNGMSAEYNSWRNMKARCLQENNTSYEHYGGRGITICEEWMDFQNFLKDMGKRPRRKTLDRIDNDGNYEPGNCRWATRKEQSNNQRKRRRICD